MSMERLIGAIREKYNPTVVGLDPKLSYLPDEIKEKALSEYGPTPEGAAKALLRFNQGIIDAVADLVPAVKPQCAYYEAFGWQGMRTLQETILYAKARGLYVITDGKRGDIGPTMEAYAAAHLGQSDAFGQSFEAFSGDALTVNGYLGSDGINPLLSVCRQQDKAIFVLVKTSNPSSGELQDKILEDKPVYEWMGDFCEEWGREDIGPSGYSPVGAVVGATWPRQLAELRERLPHTFFLIPGYGAQGGSAAALAGAFDASGNGGIVNSSRAILCAWQKQGGDYQTAARNEVLRMRQELRDILQSSAQ